MEQRIPDGARLPATRKFAADFVVSRNVAAEAYASLAADGLLLPNRGGGTTVKYSKTQERTPPRRRSTHEFVDIPRPIVDDDVNGRPIFLPPCVPDPTRLLGLGVPAGDGL
jgi:DNA-binding FadR family transcriptional regulator